MSIEMLQLTDIAKTYRTTEVETAALTNVSFSVQVGEFLAVMGPSGCGKSTLLNILGLLDRPTSGSFRFLGQEIVGIPESKLTELRRSSIGFIFQNYNLIDDLSVADNVEVALIYRRVSAKDRKYKVAEALERVGIGHRAKHLPSQLSGGQQQRVAIARALVAQPRLILADEPTGNLDSSNGNSVLELLSEAAGSGTTIVMVTHSVPHASFAKRTVKMLDGKIVAETQLGV